MQNTSHSLHVVLYHRGPPSCALCSHACTTAGPLPTACASCCAACPLHLPPRHGPYLLHAPPHRAVVTIRTMSLRTPPLHMSPCCAFITTHAMLLCTLQLHVPPHHPHHSHPCCPPHCNHNHNCGNSTPAT